MQDSWGALSRAGQRGRTPPTKLSCISASQHEGCQYVKLRYGTFSFFTPFKHIFGGGRGGGQLLATTG